MLNLIDKIVDQKGLDEFGLIFQESCAELVKRLHDEIDSFRDTLNLHIVNMGEVKDQIKQTILVLMNVKVPEKYFEKIVVMDAILEPKKKAKAKPKSKAKPKTK